MIKLDKKDIEAIARSRVNRQERQTITKWNVGAIIAIFAGLVLSRVSTLLAFAIVGLALIAYLWYSSQLSKKQRHAKNSLLKEWDEGK